MEAATFQELPRHFVSLMTLDGPTVDADRVGEIFAAEDVLLLEAKVAAEPPRLADTDLRCDVEEVSLLESGNVSAKEVEESGRVASSADLTRGKIDRARGVDRTAIRAG